MKKKFQIALLCLSTAAFSLDLMLFLHEYKTDWWKEYITDDTLPISQFTSSLPATTSNSNTQEHSENVDTPTKNSLPHNKLLITPERQEYQTGDLTLIIPKLNLNEPLQNGTDADSLNHGPGLYEYAQLPGKGDHNVSVAAHRNHSHNGVISEWFFYYIDTLCDNDYLYLTDHKNIYQYVYDQTTIVTPDNWEPIYTQGFSCLTLTSCEPIGIATHRIIVRSRLKQIIPYQKSYIYPENTEAEKSSKK